MTRLKLQNLFFAIFILFLVCGLQFVYSEESTQRKLIKRSQLYEKDQTSEVLDLSKKNDDTHLKSFNQSEIGKTFDGFLRSQQSWMPRVFKTMKSAINYLGNSKDAGHGQDQSLQTTICLIAFITIAAFLLIYLQPAFGHPRKRMSQHRRFRNGDPSPFAYRRSPPWGWGAPEEGKRYSSSEARPIMLPGPALVPVPVPPPMHVVIPTSTTNSADTQALQHQRGINRPGNKKRQKAITSGKTYSDFTASDFMLNSNPPAYNDKLTKDELLYILKTLDD